MTDTERAILQTLRDLDAAAKSLRTGGPKPDLRSLFARLDGLTRDLPRHTAPDLLHYLHKHSYEKARLWLEGRDAENARGVCGEPGGDTP